MSAEDDAFAERYYAELAAAFCRGRLDLGADCTDALALAGGRAAGLRLHKFKRNSELPRVHRVLGLLRGLAPVSLLDVGSGRGTFLWPLLAAFPELPVTALDVRADRVRDLRAVAAGGFGQLSVLECDVQEIELPAGAFDVVTALEVLEHVDDAGLTAAKLSKAARRHLIVSVPSEQDDNPEHVRFFTHEALERLLLEAGAARVTIELVRGHRIAVARVSP